jgi:hypothetical protein
MPRFDPTELRLHNDLIELVKNRIELAQLEPNLYRPWFRPAVVTVLLVTDGLDFGDGDFGLSAFITTLLEDGRRYVRFEVTLGHLRSDATDEMMLARESRISRRITDFRFDDPGHFTPDKYDEVWLFGVTTDFWVTSFATRNAQRELGGYPQDRLGDRELDNLTAHMNSGRGLFATGDHARLGRGLGGFVDRARNMRHWADFGPGAGDEVNGPGQVSMAGVNRNDSNAAGRDVGYQFSDQSDDVPQTLQLKLYHSPVGLLSEERYPHPILCSPLGRIDVFPDHPHEGEVKEPEDLGLACRDGRPEYPPRTDGSGQEAPEVIAWGQVAAGNTASATAGRPGNKLPTVAHRFAVLAAYDGHRANVGRVVTDSTWHHFVNVNLIGIFEGGIFDDFNRRGEDPSKHTGFLASPAGQAHLAKIRHYYVNTAVWLAPQGRTQAMNDAVWWDLVWSDRVVEATTLDPSSTIKDLSIVDLFHIGSQARDVLGRRTTVCRTVHLMLDLLDRWVEYNWWVNPWDPVIRVEVPVIPWFNPEPLALIALGGAVVALRDAFPYPTDQAPELSDKAWSIVRAGADYALSQALSTMMQDVERIQGLARSGLDRFAGAQAPIAQSE